jgi:hypothetical protein
MIDVMSWIIAHVFMDLLIIALVVFMTIDLIVNHWSIAFHKPREYRA